MSERPFVRLVLPLAVVVAGALAFALLAWREADRARGTETRLLRDYASFTADRFTSLATSRTQARLGPEVSEVGGGPDARPAALLRSHLKHRMAGHAERLPAVSSPLVRFVFAYDAAKDALELGGEAPAPEEQARLRETLRGLRPACGPAQVSPFGPLGTKASAGEPALSGLVETDAGGGVRRILGLQLRGQAVVESILAPLIANECECPVDVLPASLSSVKDPRRAASFVIRAADEAVLYRSKPEYSGPPVTARLAEGTPLEGLKVEVRMNPAAVLPLLPYGGRGAPWTALLLLAIVVVGASGLSFRALRREAELVRLQHDFVAGVSHELKTPLSRVRLFNELLSSGRQADASRRARYHQVIDRDCRHLTRLVEDVLDLAGRERGPSALARDPVLLRGVVEEAVEAFRATSPEARGPLLARLDEVPLVTGDAHALERAVVNLLDNAFKYSPPGGRVEVTLRSEGGRVRLSVQDEGPGIPEAERRRIFEDFYRGEAGRRAGTAGSGLGLALVRRTAEAHGGKAWVESGRGTGSVFHLEIPLPDPPLPQLEPVVAVS